MEIGVFGVDPGGATGLAWCIVDPTLKSVSEQLRTRRHRGSVTTEGSERKQIREICTLWNSFFEACRDEGIWHDRIWFICEDFVYTGSNTYSGDSAKISTSLIWGIEGYRMGMSDQLDGEMPSMILQTASEAKTYATPARLKEWDCWVRGRDHERSAHQHLAFFLRKYQIQRLG
jgi:hypothetical protein